LQQILILIFNNKLKRILIVSKNKEVCVLKHLIEWHPMDLLTSLLENLNDSNNLLENLND